MNVDTAELTALRGQVGALRHQVSRLADILQNQQGVLVRTLAELLPASTVPSGQQNGTVARRRKRHLHAVRDGAQ
jgi:hypothetical protein